MIPATPGYFIHIFPETLRDVFAVRVRGITSVGGDWSGLAGPSSILYVVCPDLFSGMRFNSQLSRKLYTIAEIPLISAGGHDVKQNKHYLSQDYEFNKIGITIMNQAFQTDLFESEDGVIIILDVWQRNGHYLSQNHNFQ